MKILPLRTLPPNEKIKRRHTPPEAAGRYGYQYYRSCLRWDFGFTCAFCLLHEGDLADFGTEGMGITWIEHFSLASIDTSRNDYENCFYSCRFCNRSRWEAPLVDESGRKLINPCSHIWGERFLLSSDDRLLPDAADPDAVYTEQTYDLNDERKVRRRRRRRERLTEWLAVLREGPARIKSLIAVAQRLTSPQDAALLVEEASSLRHLVILTTLEIQRYLAIPEDADASCSCGREEYCHLPEWLVAQSMDLLVTAE